MDATIVSLQDVPLQCCSVRSDSSLLAEHACLAIRIDDETSIVLRVLQWTRDLHATQSTVAVHPFVLKHILLHEGELATASRVERSVRVCALAADAAVSRERRASVHPFYFEVERRLLSPQKQHRSPIWATAENDTWLSSWFPRSLARHMHGMIIPGRVKWTAIPLNVRGEEFMIVLEGAESADQVVEMSSTQLTMVQRSADALTTSLSPLETIFANELQDVVRVCSAGLLLDATVADRDALSSLPCLPRAILIAGPRRNGKSTFARSLERRMARPMLDIAVVSSAEALRSVPYPNLSAALYIVDLGTEDRRCDLSLLSDCLARVRHTPRAVIVVVSALDRFHVPEMYDRTFELPTPSLRQRKYLLQNMLGDFSLADEQMQRLCKVTAGQTIGQMENLCRTALTIAPTTPHTANGDSSGLAHACEEAMSLLGLATVPSAHAPTAPSALREREKGTMDTLRERLRRKVWGYDTVLSDCLEFLLLSPIQATIKEMIGRNDTHMYERFQSLQMNGLLLYGPPGCGKSVIANALVDLLPVYAETLYGPEVFRSGVGETEKQIQKAFDRCRQNSPAMLVIEDIDVLCRKRQSETSSGGGTGDDDGLGSMYLRILSQLLTNLDGFQSSQADTSVVVVATTSRPELLDDALVRPGRIDKNVLVDLPTHQDRCAILEECRNLLPSAVDAAAVSLETFSEQLNGSTCSHVLSTWRQVIMDAVHRDPQSESVVLCDADVQNALSAAGSSAILPPSTEVLESIQRFSRRGTKTK